MECVGRWREMILPFLSRFTALFKSIESSDVRTKLVGAKIWVTRMRMMAKVFLARQLYLSLRWVMIVELRMTTNGKTRSCVRWRKMMDEKKKVLNLIDWSFSFISLLELLAVENGQQTETVNTD